MYSKYTRIFFLVILLTSSFFAVAETKPIVVLMPLELSEKDASLQGVFGSALQSGLNQRYQVYYGQTVEAVLDKEFQKIECSAKSCLLALAVEFNTSFIADAAVKHVGSGYIAKLVIRDVVDQRVIQSKAVPCEGCNQLDLLSMLESLGAGKIEAENRKANSSENREQRSRTKRLVGRAL